MQINRDILGKLIEDLSAKYITILVGARQVGKTHLLKRVQEFAKRKGLKTTFFDLEQPADLAQFNAPDKEVLNLLSQSGDVVFIDEFHYLKNASKLLKAIYDRGLPIKIFASGSSSIEIHTHLKESLVGRKRIYHIPPCGVAEITQIVPDDPLSYFVTYGGMPETTHFEDPEQKKLLLAEILQSYVLKDIKSLIREENLRAFNNLMYLLAQFQGSTVAVASLAREVGLTPRTVESHLELLAQTYVCFPLVSYSRNLGNELKKTKKYYLYDLGIRNALLKNFAKWTDRTDVGTILETFVFLALHRRLSPESELRFWRLKSGEEVDFIWIRNQEPVPIEVKKTCRLGEIPTGLKAFLKRYPKTKGAYIVSSGTEGEAVFEGVPVTYLKVENVSEIVS